MHADLPKGAPVKLSRLGESEAMKQHFQTTLIPH